MLRFAIIAALFGIIIFGALNLLGGSATARRAFGQPPPPATTGGCKISGCNSELCVDRRQNVFTTCEYRQEYGCYRTARCERQSTGLCGWTSTAGLSACLEVNRSGT